MSGPARQASGQVRALDRDILQAQKDLRALSAPQGPLTEKAALRERVADLREQRREMMLMGESGAGASSGLAEMSAAAGPWIAAATAAVAVTVGLATGIADLTIKALALAQSETELKDRSIIAFDALGDGAEGAGKRTLEMLDELGDRTGKTREQLVPWAKQLEAIGITDMGELRGQLQAVASAQALMGDTGAEAYEKLTRKIHTFSELGQGLKIPVKGLGSLAEMGIHVDEVAREMGISAHQLGLELKGGTANADQFGAALERAVLKKGVGPLSAMRVELSTVLTKGEEGFKKLFDSIDFLPISSQLHWLFSLFDDGPDHANVFKEGITGALNSIIKGLASFAEEAEHDFLQVEIFALENKMALRSLWEDIKLGGGVALLVIQEISREMGNFVRYTLKAVDAANQLLGISPTATALTPEEVDAQRAKAAPHAPANAEGGLVTRPAPGEFLASVQPGERILSKSDAANDNSGGGTAIHVENLHIDAPHGVTDATEITAHGLAIALERYQLARGY